MPFNLFGGAGSITQPMMDYVTFVQRGQQRAEVLGLDGQLLRQPASSFPAVRSGVAMGLEYRDLKGRFDPDPVVSAGFSSDIPALPTKGGYDVKEAYLELNAPLLANRPLADLLELNGAVRFSDYSTSGSTHDLQGRPQLEADQGPSFARPHGQKASALRRSASCSGHSRASTSQLDDPCSSHAGNTAPRNFQNDAAVRANCIAAGVPANGSYQQANPQISVLVGGNQKPGS